MAHHRAQKPACKTLRTWGNIYSSKSSKSCRTIRFAIGRMLRGQGLFLGAELVQDRAPRASGRRRRLQAVVGRICYAQGVINWGDHRFGTGRTNIIGFQALVDRGKKTDIDQSLPAVGAMGRGVIGAISTALALSAD